MKHCRRFTLLPIAAMLMAATSISVQAENWASTATKATVVPATKASHIAAMQAGSLTHVVVSLKLRNKAELDALTNNIMAGRSTQKLSSSEFMYRHAPTQAQVQAVIAHLKQNGFTNISVSANNMLVSADGSTASVKNAFNTDLHTYNVGGRTAHANINDVMVPQSLSNIVLAVHGLQTVHLHHTTMVKANSKTMAHRLDTVAHSPTEFAGIYNASGLPSATNATIGVITQGDMTQTIADLNTFTANAGYPQPNVSTITVGSASSDTSGIGEWNMDTQDALAAAGGTIKQMLLYTATTLSDADLTAAYNRVISDNKAQAINVSLGEFETDAQSSGIMASNDQIFQSAVAQGQTFSVSSGDSGAYECGGPGTAQSYPAVSPYVIAVGGTLLNTTNGSYTSESVWSCTDANSCQQSANGGAGGGPSLTESAPTWQTNAGVLGGATSRGVPDISFDADPSSGALVLINGSNQQIGGTSLAAPLFTGFWARVQSANNNGLGFPANAIYTNAAAHPNMFHDVTTGSNGGYSAAQGWDYASGFGSLNVSNFAAVIGNGGGVTPPPPPPPPANNVLQNGVPVTGLGLTVGNSKVYTIVVPAGHSKLTIKTSGGQGDCDIYVKLGSAPTTTSYLKKSDGPTTSENISISRPAAGTYYVLLNAYATFSGVSLVASD